jgi:hypothetical protein
VRAFLDEQLGAGQSHAGRAAGDHRDLAIELSHERKLHTPIGTERAMLTA